MQDNKNPTIGLGFDCLACSGSMELSVFKCVSFVAFLSKQTSCQNLMQCWAPCPGPHLLNS